jgi:hypothetical protein
MAPQPHAPDNEPQPDAPVIEPQPDMDDGEIVDGPTVLASVALVRTPRK